MLERAGITGGGAVDELGEGARIAAVQGVADAFEESEGWRLRRVEQGVKLAFQGWKGGAVSGEEQVDGTLRGGGLMERDKFFDGQHAIEHDGADVVAVAAEVDLSGAGAVGAAPEVDLLVAEPAPDIIDIVHGGGGGVLAEVGDGL